MIKRTVYCIVFVFGLILAMSDHPLMPITNIIGILAVLVSGITFSIKEL